MSNFNFSTPVRIVNCHVEGEIGDVIISAVGDMPGTTPRDPTDPYPLGYKLSDT